MLVNLTNIGTGSVHSDISVESRATVADVFSAADLSAPANGEFYVNRKPASLATVLTTGDSVQYSTVDVKGAVPDVPAEDSGLSMDELRTITYEDIVKAGRKEVPTDDSIWRNVYNAKIVESRSKLDELGATIFDKLEVAMLNSNNDVAALEKRLATAKEKNSRLKVATKRFMNENNIAAPLAALGLKEEAPKYFNKIGVPVPDKKDPVWHTAEADKVSE